MTTQERLDQSRCSLFAGKVFGMTAFGLFISMFTAMLMERILPSLSFWAVQLPAAVLSIIVLYVTIVNRDSLSGSGLTFGFVFYTFMEGFVLTGIFRYYDIKSIAVAFGATGGLFGVYSIVGFTTDIDLREWDTVLYTLLLGLITLLVVVIFVPVPWLIFMEIIFGLVLFSVFAIRDTQNIYKCALEGKTSYADVVLCTIDLYLDFLNVFLRLLRLFGKRK